MSETVLEILARLDTFTILYIAVAAFVSALFHSVGGYAGGLILAVAIAPVIGVRAIVPVMAVALLVSHISRTWAFRKGFQWPIYRDVMTTGLPCVILGAAIYSWLPAHGIAAILGVFLVGTVPLRYWLERRKVVVGRRSLMGAGVPFGVLAGATIGGGLILAPFFLGAGLAGMTLLGTMAAVALTVNVTKSIVFTGFGVLDPGLALLGLVIGLCTIPGNLVGRWIVLHTPIRLHVKLVEAVVMLGGCYFLYEAGRGFGVW